MKKLTTCALTRLITSCLGAYASTGNVVKDGAKRDIPYELRGELGVDMPLTKPIGFTTKGEIRLQAIRHQAWDSSLKALGYARNQSHEFV